MGVEKVDRHLLRKSMVQIKYYVSFRACSL